MCAKKRDNTVQFLCHLGQCIDVLGSHTFIPNPCKNDKYLVELKMTYDEQTPVCCLEHVTMHFFEAEIVFYVPAGAAVQN